MVESDKELENKDNDGSVDPLEVLPTDGHEVAIWKLAAQIRRNTGEMVGTIFRIVDIKNSKTSKPH